LVNTLKQTEHEFWEQVYKETLKEEKQTGRRLFECAKMDLVCMACSNPDYVVISISDDCENEHIFIDMNSEHLNFKNYEQFSEFLQNLDIEVQYAIAERKVQRKPEWKSNKDQMKSMDEL
jgi:protease II